MNRIALAIIFGILTFTACEKNSLDVRNSQISVFNYKLIEAIPRAQGGYFALVQENVDSPSIFSVITIDDAGNIIAFDQIGASSDENVMSFVNIQTAEGTSSTVLVQTDKNFIQFITIQPGQGMTQATNPVANPYTTAEWQLVVSKDHILVEGYFYVLSYLFDNANNYSLGFNRFNADGSADLDFGKKTYYMSQFESAAGPEILKFIHLKPGGFIILAAGRKGDHSGLILRLDPNGNELWRIYLQSSDYNIDGISDLRQVGASQVTAVGNTAGNNIYLLNLNTDNGNIISESIIPTGSDVQIKSIQILEDGSQIISGDVMELNTNNVMSTKIRVWKFDASGNEIFAKSYGSDFDTRAENAIQTSDNSILIIGGSTTFGLSDFLDVMVIRTNELGELQ